MTLLLALSCTLGGCFQAYTVIKVSPNGSGTLEQRLLFTTAALAQLRQFAALGGGQAIDPFSEDQARRIAADLGPGVAFVSSEPITGADAEGRLMTFTFADINQLRVSQQPIAAPNMGGRRPADQSAAITFALTRQPDGNALLRIIVPQPTIPGAAAAGPGSVPPLQAAAGQLAIVKDMLAGAHISIGIEPAGRLVRTSSPFVEGQHVTLLEIDLDQLLGDEARLARLQTARTVDDMKAALKDMPGFKFALDPEITIEFTPER